MSPPARGALTDVYVECRGADGPRSVCATADRTSRCLALHRVQWVGTLESSDSRRLLCHFRAPDAEAVRLALRQLHIRFETVWIDRRV